MTRARVTPTSRRACGNLGAPALRLVRSHRVVLTTPDSNVWGGRSGHTYTFVRQPNGTTDVDVVVVRDGKNLKRRVIGFLLGTIGKRALEKELAKAVKAIEARNTGARSSEPRRRVKGWVVLFRYPGQPIDLRGLVRSRMRRLGSM
jgi:hypothetical protein